MSLNSECKEDKQCEGWQVCCNATCGSRCVPKYLARTPQCPASSRLDSFCDMKLGNVCETDADCLSWSSCCETGCGKRCVPRFLMSDDDTCPSSHRLTPMCDLKLGDQCSGDGDCDAWQTCCETKCGHICIVKFMDDDEDGECPDSDRARRICAHNSSKTCRGDEDCSSWKQCCDLGCGKKCVYSNWHKRSEECPPSSSLSKVCSLTLGDECAEDGDCDHWQMCCDAGCGKRCVFNFFKGVNGSCPAPSRLGPMCDVNYGKECEDSDDCDLWLTCCDAGCGRRCVHRAFRHEKTDGGCPEPSGSQHVCEEGEAESCGVDGDCPGWKRCCRVGDCGKRCVYPSRKPEEGGECPAESRLGPICQMKLGERCSHHDDCEIWQSCCDAGCGKRCVMDLKTGGQEGTCPHSSRLHYVCKMNFTAPCDGDHSCGHWSSCCHTQCGPRCVPECMSTVKESLGIRLVREEAESPASGPNRGIGVTDVPLLGVEAFGELLPKKCPEISKVSILCKRNFSQACKEDDDCSFQKQCCDIGCGKKCVYAFTQGEKPGECSSPRQLSYVCNSTLGKECQSERECGKWQTCCLTPCGARCVIRSFRGDLGFGQCPAPHRLSALCELRYGALCQDNDDCYAWQSCCKTTCGSRCVHLFHSKGGQQRCPTASRLTHVCTMSLNSECKEDKQCEGWQVCCNATCGSRCVPKYLARNDDTCPSSHRLTPMCDLKLGDQCSGDGDCDAWQTCCETKCGHICIVKFMDDGEDGECPDSDRARRICAHNSSKTCRGDEDCSSWKQCCDLGCGKKCVYSNWHKRSEECPPSSSLSKVCSLTLGDECAEDGDCDHWQMCCDAGCGKRCVFNFFKGVNGSCPAPSRLGPMCDVNYGKECEDSDDCDLWLTCCDAGCGRRCVHRTFRH
ncbi:cysteine-rich, acidic integral membrane protein-like, partial [Carcharodon carcharias]|uniref:cysteine-rich, acidic integral membrane protein-like n=1 Tax=Carcharodon carcharias TaxID=13397 RepID=UPI001B7E86FE